MHSSWACWVPPLLVHMRSPARSWESLSIACDTKPRFLLAWRFGALSVRPPLCPELLLHCCCFGPPRGSVSRSTSQLQCPCWPCTTPAKPGREHLELIRQASTWEL